MSPGASQQNNKSKNGKSKNVDFDEEEKLVKRRVDEGDDFDVVESDADAVSSSEEEEGGKPTKKGIKAKKEAERVKKRLAEISQVKKKTNSDL
jgi:hypothetical protein